ncbi:hNH endonuclease:HNH nuclease [Coprobacillus sp. CAG:698]|nr:hNH endonuclease:HNH nuclease [Coprobacillus sp. CAG:698]
MINDYINKWITVIEQMNNDNTYKLAWGRAILECISFNKYKFESENVVICFNDISECMIKYYWNQLFFFNLKQAPYKDKYPKICQYTMELIDLYKKTSNTTIPIWFDEARPKLNKDYYNKVVSNVSKTLHENVSWRFKRVGKDELNLYRYCKDEGSFISINKNELELLKEYSVILSKLLNYKWAQLLEKFNFCPKIVNKVNGISEAKLCRNSLSKYKDELLKEFKDGKVIDFYTGEELENDNISIDHVIPWSFMYSDDIWNLVVTSKSYNSSKSNSIPSEEVISKLKQRNEKLVNLLNGKYKDDLLLSIENNYLEKFYYECRL